RAHGVRILLHRFFDVEHLSRADSWHVPDAGLDFAAVLPGQSGRGAVDFDQSRYPRSCRPDGAWDFFAVDLSLGLRLSDRLDAVAAQTPGLLLSHHLDDRRLAERHPPRRRLARAVAARRYPLVHGRRRPRLRLAAGAEAAMKKLSSQP